MNPPVAITFDCLPLRSVGRMDIPLDASPAFQAFCERVKSAVERHGTHNTYYLHNAHCVYHLSNDPKVGMLEFQFEGTVFTDAEDRKTLRADLDVKLRRETCDWITEPEVAWFRETVSRAVIVEFDRYISAGDLEKTVARIEKTQAESDSHGGFVGMGL
jgi:hypothetical protein